MVANSLQFAKETQRLYAQCQEDVQSGNMAALEDHREELWELYDAREGFSADVQRAIAAVLANVMLVSGSVHYFQKDYLKVAGFVNDMRGIKDANADNESVNESYVQMFGSFMELKFEFREFDYLEDYIPEMIEISRHFPTAGDLNKLLMGTFVNLINLAPYGDVGVSVIEKALTQMDAIVEHFPADAMINLAMCHALVTFCSAMRGHPRQEIYEKYRARLEQLLTERGQLFDPKDLAEVRREMARVSL